MIRKAETKDIEAIMNLLVQVNNVHAQGRPDLFVAGTTKYDAEAVEAILSDESTPVFAYTDADDRMLAYCFCIVQDHSSSHILQPVRTLYIDDLCVDAAQRGRHIGRQLFEYVRQWAHDNGFYNLTLNVWSCNPTAEAFYRNMGLIPQKTTLEIVLG